MLKSDLIAILVAKRQLTQKQAEQTIETIFDSMKNALCKGDNIEIRGLGAFHVTPVHGEPADTAQDFRTGRPRGVWLEQLDGSVTGVDADSGGGVRGGDPHVDFGEERRRRHRPHRQSP